MIEPLSGENIYSEHMAHKGEGLHHIGVFVPSLEGAVAEAARQGFAVLQSGRGYGRRGDGGFAYLDTEGVLGVILELIEVPQERIAPERTYPPS